MAIFSVVVWLRNPFRGNKAEVTVNRIKGKELPFMFLADGNYPDTFKNVDADFWIDDLKRKETKDPSNYQKTYSFRGWYTDAECTQPFDGLVKSGTGHDVVIYAKIAVGWWTPWNPL